MLRKLTLVLAAATVLAAPVLAQTSTPQSGATPAPQVQTTQQPKAGVPAKAVKHVRKSHRAGKHARHGKRAKTAKVSGQKYLQSNAVAPASR